MKVSDILLDYFVCDPFNSLIINSIQFPYCLLTQGPYEQSSFELTFRPSSLTEVAISTVIIANPLFGELVYDVSGAGLLPSLMPHVQMFSPLGEIGSHTIAFRNPFPFSLPVDILLTGNSLSLSPSPSPSLSLSLSLCHAYSIFASR